MTINESAKASFGVRQSANVTMVVADIDPVAVLLNDTRKREVFLADRLNGSDVEEDAAYVDWKLSRIKQQHTDWLIEAPWGF